MPTTAPRELQILIIDDDDVDRERVRRCLRGSALSAHTMEADSGNEAMHILRSHAIDCVLLDNCLGDTTGSALLRAIRELTSYEGPIIMVTGAGSESLVVEAMQEGASDYVPRVQLDAERLTQAILRSLAGIAAPMHDYGQRGVVAYVETELPHRLTAWQRFLPGGPLAFLPVDAGHRSSIVWSLPQDEAERVLALGDEAFGIELTNAFAARLGTVSPVSRRVAFPLRRQLAARQRGDAVAHRAGACLDHETGLAPVVSGMTHQRRGHDQVLLRIQLALEFLHEAYERTSAIHGNVLVTMEKRGRHHPLAGMHIPARVDGRPAIGRSG